MSIQIRYNINMFKKILLLITILFLWTIPSTVKAEGIVPVICSMKEYNYCKDIKKIIEYTPEYEPVKIYGHGHYNTIIEHTPEYEPVKIYGHGHYNTIIEYTPEYEPVKIYALIKY